MGGDVLTRGHWYEQNFRGPTGRRGSGTLGLRSVFKGFGDPSRWGGPTVGRGAFLPGHLLSPIPDLRGRGTVSGAVRPKNRRAGAAKNPSVHFGGKPARSTSKLGGRGLGADHIFFVLGGK